MIADLIEYAANPFPWHLAPMGYVREVRMTGQRARETGTAWNDHLVATRGVIEESAGMCRKRKRVVVLGAGNLLDVPLDTLAKTFEDVVLLDIFHPRTTRKLVRQKRNVTLIDCDVTGVSRQVFDAARRRDVKDLPTSVPPTLNFDAVDLIVSVNLLSQLAVIPASYMKGHCPNISADELSAFSRNLIEAHLAWLSADAEQVCLVTDVSRVERFSDGRVTRKEIVQGVPLPRPDKTWDWQIAPKGSIYRDRDVYHHVQAYTDYRTVSD